MPGKEGKHSSDMRHEDYSDETFESDSGSINSPIVRRRNTKTQRNPLNSNRGRTSPNQPKPGVKRILSARNKKIHDLSSRIECLEKELAEAKVENKTLRRQAYRQEKALEKSLQIDHSQSELPSLIERHAEEVRCLKEQIKRYKERLLTEEGLKKDLESEVNRLRKKCTKFKQLADDKELLERDALRQEVNQLKETDTNKSKRIEELERKMDLLSKNHRVELGNANGRNKVLGETVKRSESRIEELETQIKEKEKMLEIHNIYSQRVMRQPHRLDSGSGSTPSLNQLQFTSQWHNQHMRDTRSEIDLITPREKMKVFDERRRSEQRRKFEKKERKRREKALLSSSSDPGDSGSDYALSADGNKEALIPIDEKDEHRQATSDTFDLTTQNPHGHDEDRSKKNDEENKHSSKEEKNQETKSPNPTDNSPRPKEDIDPIDRVIEENKIDPQPIEDINCNQTSSDPPNDQLEDEKLKEELKIQQEIENSEKEAERRRKEELLAELKKLDNPSDSETRVGNSYSFSEKVENMHRGKPSSSNNPKTDHLKKRNSEEKREELLMEDLFGSKTKDTNSSRITTVQPQNINSDDRIYSSDSFNDDESGKKLYKRPNQKRMIISKPAPAPAPGVVEDADDIEQLIL